MMSFSTVKLTGPSSSLLPASIVPPRTNPGQDMTVSPVGPWSPGAPLAPPSCAPPAPLRRRPPAPFRRPALTRHPKSDISFNGWSHVCGSRRWACSGRCRAVDSFSGKLAVVTGGGSGMGRELVRQLAAEGCSVAACDRNADSVGQAAAMAQDGAPAGVRVTSHACDVSDEAQVLRFRDELLQEHNSNHVDLVFNNAGTGGGESFVKSGREVWEQVFATDWWGVYYCARAFLPLLIASGDGVLVNTSSVNGLWAALGPGMPNSA